MTHRILRISGKRHPIRAFAVALLMAAITIPAATAWADDCAAVDVVIARGTGEPGLLGAVIGDPLYDALATGLPVDSDAYAVRYPASMMFASSLSAGIADMTGHLVERAAHCPGQRFVLVGYSQGALVVHGVLGGLPPGVGPRVAAVLLFGDPLVAVGVNVAATYLERTGNYCAGGDPICGAGVDSVAHITYGWAIGPAVWFVAARL